MTALTTLTFLLLFNIFSLLPSSRRLASGEGIVALGVRLSRCVCFCLSVRLAATARARISVGGEGNALYPVLSNSYVNLVVSKRDIHYERLLLFFFFK